MRVMVVVKANKDSEAGVLPDRKILTEMGKFNEQLAKAGVMLAAEGLQASSKGKRVRFDGDKRTVIDGPFTETKELIAGFWLWQVRSMDEAVEWLKRAPFGGGTEIEIRPVFETADFGDAVTPELAAQENRRRKKLQRNFYRRPRRAGRRTRAVAGHGRPAKPWRVAHGDRQAARDRSLAPQQAVRAQARGASP